MCCSSQMCVEMKLTALAVVCRVWAVSVLRSVWPCENVVPDHHQTDGFREMLSDIQPYVSFLTCWLLFLFFRSGACISSGALLVQRQNCFLGLSSLVPDAEGGLMLWHHMEADPYFVWSRGVNLCSLWLMVCALYRQASGSGVVWCPAGAWSHSS